MLPGMESAPTIPTWTTERPTKEGFYWTRGPDHEELNKIEGWDDDYKGSVVTVTKRYDGRLITNAWVVILDSGGNACNEWALLDTCPEEQEWSGPLEAPE